jgi:hypothetical protein
MRNNSRCLLVGCHCCGMLCMQLRLLVGVRTGHLSRHSCRCGHFMLQLPLRRHMGSMCSLLVCMCLVCHGYLHRMHCCCCFHVRLLRGDSML